MTMKPVTTALLALGVAAATAAGFATEGEAQVADCPIYGKVKSKKSTTPVAVTFDNMSGETRGVFWVDFNGEWVKYGDLKPGQRRTFNTFVAHPWIFTDTPGNCVEMFIPRKDILTFNVTAESKGKGAR
jgi:hypothetical protein